MKRTLPSITGLRGISVLLVIIFHYQIFFAEQMDWGNSYNYFFYQIGHLGVNVFFVISGFLITTLLLHEEAATGKISLTNFYFRRTFRIFPAFYFLLVVYFILQLNGYIHLSPLSWISSLTYTKYLFLSDRDTGHLWSLSIEEHFYILWPFVFKYCKKWRKSFAWIIVFSIPILRIIAGKFGIGWMNGLTIFQRADVIMWGCLLALYSKQLDIVYYQSKKTKTFFYILPVVLTCLSLFLELLNYLYASQFAAIITAVGTTSGTLISVSLCFLLFLSIHEVNNYFYKFLNTKALNYIGKLSYSLYLWQQVFIIGSLGMIIPFPINFVCVLIFSNISYYLIEKPCLKLKDKVSNIRLTTFLSKNGFLRKEQPGKSLTAS